MPGRRLRIVHAERGVTDLVDVGTRTRPERVGVRVPLPCSKDCSLFVAACRHSSLARASGADDSLDTGQPGQPTCVERLSDSRVAVS